MLPSVQEHSHRAYNKLDSWLLSTLQFPCHLYQQKKININSLINMSETIDINYPNFIIPFAYCNGYKHLYIRNCYSRL